MKARGESLRRVQALLFCLLATPPHLQKLQSASSHAAAQPGSICVVHERST